MKALIIGGGIAGLTTGIALEQIGFETEIFEATPELQVAGAGIWMAANAMQVFDRLGMARKITNQGTALDRIDVTDQDLIPIQRSHQAFVKEHYGFSVTSILRARLSETLADHYPGTLHVDKRFTGLEETSERVKARFEDGSTTSGDFLVGADGIHSSVRKHVVPASPLRYSGQTCWRGIATISLKPPYRNGCVEAWGSRCRFGFSVISDEEVYWFLVAKAPLGQKDAPTGVRAKIRKMIAGFADPVPSFIEVTPEDRIIRNDISDLRRLPTWHSGRVCLIGDAAHATTPNMGQGGGQAVEDAWFLAQILRTEKDLMKAFRKFEGKRRKKVDDIVKTSWRIGQLAHIPFGRSARNFFLRRIPSGFQEKMTLDLYNIDY